VFPTHTLPAALNSEETVGVIDEFTLDYCGSREQDPVYQILDGAMPMRGRLAFARRVSLATLRPIAALKVQPQMR
jgi:hypothetical protein